MSTSRLSDRSRRILAALVAEHVETGEPVASGTLVRHGGMDLSSATIRNVLASLEEQGYVYQPHTSSGRVPTDLGYRCYVDMLLGSRRPARLPGIEAQLRSQTGAAPLIEDALTKVSHVLSAASHHVGFALAPEAGESAFRRIDFVLLADTRILVVVVMRGGQITNKVVDIGERLPVDDLHKAANYLNEEFAGRPLQEVRAAVMARLAEERVLYDQLLSRALRLARSAFEGLPPQQALFIEGFASLVEETAEGAVSLGTLRALLTMIEEKHRLLRILAEYMEGPGLTVIIGEEHRAPDLRAFSLVTASYSDGDRRGSIGVIGPTRMHYSKAISIVDSVARTITSLLQQGVGD
ncbi:MAG: hrcA [Acidobacteria bacterium]|nr:hrcA [Acidobacteriota bacterium]